MAQSNKLPDTLWIIDIIKVRWKRAYSPTTIFPLAVIYQVPISVTNPLRNIYFCKQAEKWLYGFPIWAYSKNWFFCFYTINILNICFRTYIVIIKTTPMHWQPSGQLPGVDKNCFFSVLFSLSVFVHSPDVRKLICWLYERALHYWGFRTTMVHLCHLFFMTNSLTTSKT